MEASEEVDTINYDESEEQQFEQQIKYDFNISECSLHCEKVLLNKNRNKSTYLFINLGLSVLSNSHQKRI